MQRNTLANNAVNVYCVLFADNWLEERIQALEDHEADQERMKIRMAEEEISLLAGPGNVSQVTYRVDRASMFRSVNVDFDTIGC